MKKFQYSCKFLTNEQGVVAQCREDVVGYRVYTDTGYFQDLETLLAKLKNWTGGMYEFFLSPLDAEFNIQAPKVAYRETGDCVTGVIAWIGPYEHDHIYIEVC